MSPSMVCPRKWRYTWEAQARSPNIKLFLFDSQTKPSLNCVNLRVEFLLSKSLLLVTWTSQSRNSAGEEIISSLRVPVPKVLIDPEAPVHSRPLNDHIEVKLLLLLPVDHPLLSSFDSDKDCNTPRSAEADLKSLSSSKEGVQFYCKSCEATLTKAPIRHLVEMPSVNWRELADNWFGGCCCSFGGAGEMLVDRYVDAYTCTGGVCYLSSSAVTLCKDDLVLGSQLSDKDGYRKAAADGDSVETEEEIGVGGAGSHRESLEMNELQERTRLLAFTENGRRKDGVEESKDPSQYMALKTGYRKAAADGDSVEKEEEIGVGGAGSCHESLEMNELQEGTRLLVFTENGRRKDGVEESEDPPQYMALKTGCCGSTCHSGEDFDEVDGHTVLEPSLLKPDQRSFLNGFLGDGFITRSQNLSTDIKWRQFNCPVCSALLGVWPHTVEGAVVDNGVRLFKCNVATSLPVGGPEDLFREYTLDRMVSGQLVESEKDELSFRTLVRNLETRFPVLRVILVNSSSWQCSGFCLDADSASETPLKSNLQPIVKILFSACSDDEESSTRALKDWVTKHQPDEFFMMRGLIEKLAASLVATKDVLPGSCTAVQGFTVSSMQR